VVVVRQRGGAYGLGTIGLIIHEISTERVVHELSVGHEGARAESRA
jgi:hypothetical protein